MKNTTMHAAVIALAVVFGSALSIAQDKPAAPAASSAQSAKKKDSKSAQPVKQVDINSASKQELKKLPNIGDAEADRIIAGRPYLSKADLVTRNIIPEGYYVSMRRMIVALPKPDPKAKNAGKKS